MSSPVPVPDSPTPAVVPPLESVPLGAVEILGSEAPAGAECLVPTGSRPGARPKGEPPAKGRQGRWLKSGTELQKVKGYRTREEIIRLHVYEGKSLRETARLVGRHYNYVCLVWQGVVAECSGEKKTPEAHRGAVRAYCDKHLRRVIEEAQPLLGDAAAYGAVVVAGVKALADLHGLKPEEVAPVGFSLEDVGREVRVVSPLLIDKIDRVRVLAGAASRGEGVASGGPGKVVPVLAEAAAPE